MLRIRVLAISELPEEAYTARKKGHGCTAADAVAAGRRRPGMRHNRARASEAGSGSEGPRGAAGVG